MFRPWLLLILELTPPQEPIPPQFTISFNIVQDYGLEILSDFGGIYLSSDDNTCFTKGTCYLASTVHNNVVQHGRHYNYGSQGVYMDEQVAGQNITQNLFADIGDGGVYFHCGGHQYVLLGAFSHSRQRQNVGRAPVSMLLAQAGPSFPSPCLSTALSPNGLRYNVYRW